MRLESNEVKNQLIGALIATFFGLGLMITGCRFIAYDYLLTDSVSVIGNVIDSGSTRSSGGGRINFVEYQFSDQVGKTHSGKSARYSGGIGETILVEYAERFPYIHRVAGEGNHGGFKWRWYIFAFGLFFFIVGTHWGWSSWLAIKKRDDISP